MRRVTAAVSVVSLLVVAAAVAEASLLGLLVVFGTVLRLSIVLEIAGHSMYLAPLNASSSLEISIANAGTVGSFLVTLTCGVIAAVYRYRRWRPVP